MVLRCSAELVPEASYADLDPEQRLSLTSLVNIVRGTVPLGKEPTIDDYFHAEPKAIERGLYINPRNPKYRQAQHVVTLGVPPRPENIITLGDLAVVFPPTEYAIVARNSRDLGRASVSRTAKARLNEPSASEAHNTSMRSAGHTLIAKRDAQGRLLNVLGSEREDYKALYRDLITPFRTRYKAKNLEKKRALLDEKVHETIEVASVFLELDDPALAGLHKATRKNLYNGNYSSSEFAYNWVRSLIMVGLHNAAKAYKLRLSSELCLEELKMYKPYLDDQPS
jgi:hypothetical protein